MTETTLWTDEISGIDGMTTEWTPQWQWAADYSKPWCRQQRKISHRASTFGSLARRTLTSWKIWGAVVTPTARANEHGTPCIVEPRRFEWIGYGIQQKKVSRFFISYYSGPTARQGKTNAIINSSKCSYYRSTPTTMLGEITEYSITANVQPLALHVLVMLWRCIPVLATLEVVQGPTSQHWLPVDNPATQSIAVHSTLLLHSVRQSSTVVAVEDRSSTPP